MTFTRRDRQEKRPADRSSLAHAALAPVRFLSRAAFGIVTVLVIVAGLLFLRLSQGPIHLPLAAGIATRLFNENADRIEVELGNMILTMGGKGDPSGIQFVDVSVTGADGQELFSIPRLTASFDTRDLVKGYLRPTRITLIRPVARVLRMQDGRFRFGLGTLPDEQTGDNVLVEETPQLAAISRFLDSLAGDQTPVPELARLKLIRIMDADLSFENQAAGRNWRTRHADFTIRRAEAGLRAGLSIGLADGTQAGARIDIIAERRRGAKGATQVAARFDRLRPEHLAEQLEQMEWLRLFDAPLDGEVELTAYPDGRIEGLAGRIAAGPGRILALEEHGKRFESAELAFAYEPGLERMQVSALHLISPAFDTRLSGFADLQRGPGGDVTGVTGQFEVGGMKISIPQSFVEPLQFDGGQIVAGIAFEPMRIDVAQAHLRRGELVIDVTGNAVTEDEGWRTDLRAGGRNMTVQQLVEHWPLVAAPNARTWVDTNISRGTIDEFVALIRFSADDARLNMDFTYSGLDSTYLDDMSPIRNAIGRGSVTLDEFHLEMASGEVEPIAGSPVRLDGSVVRMLDLQVTPSPADISIVASGDTNSILALIDQQPLGLMAKLGLEPSTIGGQAEVTTRVQFPLLARLLLDEVQADASATLAALRLPFVLPGGYRANVAGSEVALRANTREMGLAGRVTVDGVPLTIDWNEYYGRGSNHRTIALDGAVTPALLAQFGLENPVFAEGRAPMRLRLEQAGAPDFSFNLGADLSPAGLTVTDIGWSKPAGAAGRLDAEGTFGQTLRISKFRLDTGDLKASGAIDLGAGGGLTAAQIDRLQYRGKLDLAVRVAPNAEGGGLAVTVTGDRLDLSLLDDLPAGQEADGPVTPLTVDFNINDLLLNPKMPVRPASGTYRRSADRVVTARLGGQMAGRVAFIAEYGRTGNEVATAEIRSDDAGGLLTAADLFSGAQGGKLRLKARIPPGPGAAVTGIAKIEDVTISGSGTFKSILDEGGIEKAASAAEEGGLFFDTVRVPFEYGNGVMILGESLAKGTLLAVKVGGTLDETTQAIDLVGVISPAYALTGILDNIPVLGTILSGGKGEGILAMTFAVSGPLDQPSFSVNPISLLTPGFLRNIFAGRTAKPDERFIETLRREID